MGARLDFRLMEMIIVVGFVEGFAQNKHAFLTNFSLPDGVGGNVPKATVACQRCLIASSHASLASQFHKSPARGVGMFRLVSSCAMSRHGISHISCRIGRKVSVTSRALAMAGKLASKIARKLAVQSYHEVGSSFYRRPW
jgi:hypothetical protein